MKRHTPEFDLALYASGDLAPVRRAVVWLHVRRCEECGARVEAFRADRLKLQQSSANLPEGLDWDALAGEMTANIRVGLAAGECVAPRSHKVSAWPWRPAAVAAGVTALVMAAWLLNTPFADTEALGRVFHAIGGRVTSPAEERGSVVEASFSGVEVRENGSRMGIEQTNLRPVTFSVSAQGSASARYVDDDTGQVTITSVYVQ
jgi:anti-sigma factor RsiW